VASTVEVNAANNMPSEAPKEKTVKEMLEEREIELKELEQLQTLQTTDYIEALVTDTAAPSKSESK
jgi:hypothetical protein